MRSNALRIVSVVGLIVLVSCGSGGGDREQLLGEEPMSPITVGTKNFRQLDASLSHALGVPEAEFSISDFRQTSGSRLPADNRADKTSPASLLATVGLTSAYCNQFLTREALAAPAKRKALGDLDLAGGMAKFTPDVQRRVVTNFTKLLWLREPTDSEFSELSAMMTAIAAESERKKRQLPDALLGLCTVVGSSADAIRL